MQLDAFTATVGTIPDNFEVVHDDLSDTGTGWHGQSDWRLEGGISDFDPLSYLVDQVYPAVLTWMGMAGRSSTSVVKQLDLYPIDTSGRAIAPAGYGAPVPASIIFDTDAGPAGSTSGQYALPRPLVPVRIARVSRGARGAVACSSGASRRPPPTTTGSSLQRS